MLLASYKKAIELALRKVPDLTEVELVETLKTILILHRQNVNGVAHPPDAMQVDSELPSVPSEPDSSNSMPLERYLRLMMNYPTTRIPLLLSFIRHLQDPEDITILLRLLSDWFTKRSQITAEEECHELLPGPKDVKKTTEGVWIVVGKSEPAQVQETVPSLEKVRLSLNLPFSHTLKSLQDNKPYLNVARLLFPLPLVLQAFAPDFADNIVADRAGTCFHPRRTEPAWGARAVCAPSSENAEGFIAVQGRQGETETEGRLAAEEKGCRRGNWGPRGRRRDVYSGGTCTLSVI